MDTIKGGLLTIYIDPDFRTKSMETANSWADYFEMDAAKKQAYLDEAARLCDLHDRIVNQFPELNIFDFIPVTKSGHAARDQTILLADTGKSNLFNMEFQTKRLQLRLVPYHGDENLILSGGCLEDSFLFKIDAFSNKTLTEPVFDRHGIPRKVTRAKNKYIDDANVTPGTVYAELKGTEYLYLGDLDIETVLHVNGAMDPDDIALYKKQRDLRVHSINDIPMPTSKDLSEWAPCHCYLRMTKKLEAMAAGCKNLDEFIEKFIQANSKGYTQWAEKLSTREKPRKFVSQSKTLFEDNKINPIWRSGPAEHDSYHGDISYKWRIVPVPYGARKGGRV